MSGAVMLAAAFCALLWANSPWQESYHSLRELSLGPLDVAHWTQDGLLAIFFMVAGLELRHQLTKGELRSVRKAVLPIVAALGGMVMPAAVYLLISSSDPTATKGWAIPVATDIAFALAVLAVAGKSLPTTLRAFLLTLAIVDDIVAILIIATLFAKKIDLLALLLVILVLAIYGLTQKMGLHQWWIALPLGISAWILMFNSGVHATIAGVALGLLTEGSERYERFLEPISSWVVVPLFALMTAGVTLKWNSFATDQAAIAVAIALVVGKVLGVFGTTALVSRFSRAELFIGWRDLLGISFLAGIGFTVSLLISSLTFGTTGRGENVIAGVLLGSLISAVLGAILLATSRNRRQTLG